jgi:hypothetical protein
MLDDDFLWYLRCSPPIQKRKPSVIYPEEEIILTLNNNRFNGNRIVRVEPEDANSTQYMDFWKLIKLAVSRGRNWSKNRKYRIQNNK